MIKHALDIEIVKKSYIEKLKALQKRIVVCAGTGCVANGSLGVYESLLVELKKRHIDVAVELDQHDKCDIYLSSSGCQGFCQAGPLVTIEPAGYLYVHVKVDDVADIVEQTIINDKPVERLLYVNPADGIKHAKTNDIPFYSKQNRYVLGQCGHINPGDIKEYIAAGGYDAAKKAFTQMSPIQICEEITVSGLRGRGGGGFPTGIKWQLTLKQQNSEKYVICNGDEGDPGAFMDRSLLEGNPHRVIEGMIIAARAIGADCAWFYIRAEYPLAVQRVRKAVADAIEAGILGENIFGTSNNLHIEIMEGAGAFVCGEETALIASIEGKRGMPMPKPPFPAQSGLWGKPTVINNVETLATVPLIINHGAHTFRTLGTENSPGTKTFALTGHVANTGLIEVSFGTALKNIIFDIGGGVTDNIGNIDNDNFKAVQIGGPSGGCLTTEHLDLPIDFDSVKKAGVMVGSGGLVVMNRDTCMVQIAHFFMQFTQKESCGKCVPCREGTKQMLVLLEDIIQGRADSKTLEVLESLALAVQKGSLCGLGKTAPNPVLSTLKHFRSEYETHVFQKRCPTNQCKALAIPEIITDKCKGCTICTKKCPVGAISGTVKQPHRIDPEKCIKCGVCVTLCKFNAITGI